MKKHRVRTTTTLRMNNKNPLILKFLFLLNVPVFISTSMCFLLFYSFHEYSVSQISSEHEECCKFSSIYSYTHIYLSIYTGKHGWYPLLLTKTNWFPFFLFILLFSGNQYLFRRKEVLRRHLWKNCIFSLFIVWCLK